MFASGFGWHRALAYALTGQDFADLEPTPTPDVDEALGLLAERGWDRDRIAATAAQAAGRWPFPIPADVRGDLGSAQLLATVGQARHILRLDGPSQMIASRPLNADERRLLRDVPPHHGRA